MQATGVATILRPQSPYIYGNGQAAMPRPLRTHARTDPQGMGSKWSWSPHFVLGTVLNRCDDSDANTVQAAKYHSNVM